MTQPNPYGYPTPPKKSKLPWILGAVAAVILLMILGTILGVAALMSNSKPDPTLAPTPVVTATTEATVPPLPTITVKPTITVPPVTAAPVPERSVNPIMRSAFLKTVKSKAAYSRGSDSGLVDAGLTACSDFDNGQTFLGMVKDIIDNNPQISVEDAGYFIGAAIVGFCPEHLDKLSE